MYLEWFDNWMIAQTSYAIKNHQVLFELTIIAGRYHSGKVYFSIYGSWKIIMLKKVRIDGTSREVYQFRYRMRLMLSTDHSSNCDILLTFSHALSVISSWYVSSSFSPNLLSDTIILLETNVRLLLSTLTITSVCFLS